MMLRVIAAVLALVVSGLPGTAQVFPAPESDTVSDFARVLDPQDEARIAALLARTREETGVQMVVVTMSDIALFGGSGQRLDAYAKALFNAWGVGGAERNDGIMMLVATDAREVRIALGQGYDAVYDGRAARVLTTAVLPEFREGRIPSGIEAGIASARDRLIAPFLAGQPVTLNDGFEADDGSSSSSWIAGLIAAVGGAAYLVRRSLRSRKVCPRCGEPTLKRTFEVIEPATRLQDGTGIEHLACSNCGFVDRKSHSLRRGSSSNRFAAGALGAAGSRSGGGDSGFGGGKSSGGGASGKW
jgi:uncharacterized protein